MIIFYPNTKKNFINIKFWNIIKKKKKEDDI
jgi:hypothetical protein